MAQNKPDTWYLDSLQRLNELQIQSILVKFVGSDYIDKIRELYDTINRLHEKNRVVHCAKLHVNYVQIETNENKENDK